MSVRNRIIIAYVCWGIAALSTTLEWANDGRRGANGHLFNGQAAMVMMLAAAGLIAWWDRGNRFDRGRIKTALISGGLGIAVVLRNMYDINDRFELGFGIWISLAAGLAGMAVTSTLLKR